MNSWQAAIEASVKWLQAHPKSAHLILGFVLGFVAAMAL